MAVVLTSLFLFSAILLVPTLAVAEDGLALLQRIAQGSRQLTYSGTFVYRSGDKVDTSRIAHSLIDGLEAERIEALDGSPREVVRIGLKLNASAVIFAHNHPSGTPEPSRADEMLTNQLRQALSLVDVKVLDHFIVADTTVMSFAEMGLI